MISAAGVSTCESAPKRDPGQNSSKSLKSSAKTPEVGSRSTPIGAPPETKTPSVYQGVEAYPRWGPASALIHIQAWLLGRQGGNQLWRFHDIEDAPEIARFCATPEALSKRSFLLPRLCRRQRNACRPPSRRSAIFHPRDPILVVRSALMIDDPASI